MNTTITIQDRVWLPLVAAGVALALAVGLLAYVVLEQRPDARRADDPTPTIQAPTALPQAKWKVQVSPAGAKRISKADRVRVQRRAAGVVGVVQTVFDTLFLDPTNTEAVVAGSFTKGAAQAFQRADAGVPDGAEDVQTTRRRVWISMYAGTASQATARAEIRLKAVVDGGPVRVRHGASLWLQRGDKGWKVIAFEVTQEP